MSAFTDSLLSCLCSQVALTPGGATCFCGMVPGTQPPMEFCSPCDSDVCGMAWLRLARIFPSNRFPTPVLEANGCKAPLAYEWQMGVWRCMPTMDTDGNPPGEAAQAMAAAVLIGDAQAMYQALVCCLDKLPRELAVGQYTPVGPFGGCGGGTWTFVTREV